MIGKGMGELRRCFYEVSSLLPDKLPAICSTEVVWMMVMLSLYMTIYPSISLYYIKIGVISSFNFPLEIPTDKKIIISTKYRKKYISHVIMNAIAVTSKLNIIKKMYRYDIIGLYFI
jgi:hypothetical protein